jgi:hypothetical protein
MSGGMNRIMISMEMFVCPGVIILKICSGGMNTI